MPPTERSLAALAAHGIDPRRAGAGWSARCPAHEDRLKSLSICGGEDGRAVSAVQNAAAPDYTCAYRAVSEAEYQQILITGRFEVPLGRPGFGPMEGKWFADSLKSAAAHGIALQGHGNFHLIEADLPNNAPSLFLHPNIDGRGPGRYLDIKDLSGVTPRSLR